MSDMNDNQVEFTPEDVTRLETLIAQDDSPFLRNLVQKMRSLLPIPQQENGTGLKLVGYGVGTVTPPDQKHLLTEGK